MKSLKGFGYALVLVSGIVINNAVGTNLQVLLGAAFLITGTWFIAGAAFENIYEKQMKNKEK